MKCSETVFLITIRGLVQGVGFRPFIYRLAKEMGIKGEVGNRNNGVYVYVVGTSNQCKQLVKRIEYEHPDVACIHRIEVSEMSLSPSSYTDFCITPSSSSSEEITQVAPDMAVCQLCLQDREKQRHRLQYPFINCTHCGPRFSIIRDLPYDRPHTTMATFAMCPDCHEEFVKVDDRRFHAQPIACNQCGPSYYATYNHVTYTDYNFLLDLSSALLEKGEVIAVKGIGGYHLVCDATNAQAVTQLRKIKIRDRKPFAVMFRNIESLNGYASVNKVEEDCLLSWRRPIVLLKQVASLAPGINPGMNTLGCMLPYMPIHFDWFDRIASPALVMTSGNVSECPILIELDEAESQLKDKVSLVLHHNRDIYNRVDDSVLQVCGAQPCLIRRSRGYVPEPIFADDKMEGILAFGAEKVNVFAVGKGDLVLQSQYIGDLKNWETFCFYIESLERFKHLFHFIPLQLVCDLHPDYFSSRQAERMSEEQKVPLLKVQHHHAHAAGCMLEYGLRRPVIACVLDGTGLGDDGKVWGGEIFYCDRSRYTRLSHLEYVPMPGGDKASVEPWRMAVAWLWHCYGTDIPFPSGFVDRIGVSKIQWVIQMMEKGVNTPYTSSAGRLFDAVASLLGVCDISTHQSEAPMRLEQLANFEQSARYPVIKEEGVIVCRSLWDGILNDLAIGLPTDEIAARFHNTMAYLLLDEAKYFMKQTGASEVVISGGCFQNKRLTEQLQQLFASAHIPLYIPCQIPCNDGGIAVGQMAVAAARNKEIY